MSNLDEWFNVYEKSRLLWEENLFDEAKENLENYWEKTGIKTLPQMVLYAYILRSKKQYVTLINFLEETLEIFKTAKELNFLAVLYSLLGESYQKIGDTKKAAKFFLKSSVLDPNFEKKLTEISNAIFSRGASDFSPEEMEFYYQKYRETLKNFNIKPFEKRKYNHKQIRIGYLSADLHSHPVADFVRALLLNYDTEKFQVYVYHLGNIFDDVTSVLKTGKTIWRDVFGVNFKEIAKIIYDDEIDILMDLSGHTANNGLPVLAYQPATVQISGIGYVLSTGLNFIDGFLTDIYASPKENSPYFTEKLLRLKHSHFCYSPFQKFPEILNAPCLKNNYITFGSFNNFSKVTDEVLKTWNEILIKIPNSKIILKHSLFDSDEGLAYTKNRIKSLNLNLDRFEFRGFNNDYLSEYNDIDIALDTFPYTGGATTLEAMMMGAPLVTLAGKRHGSRFGVSFLENLNLAELIAKSQNNYIDIAVALANDAELLTILRKNLRQKMLTSPLMNENNYMLEIEELYKKLKNYRFPK